MPPAPVSPAPRPPRRPLVRALGVLFCALALVAPSPARGARPASSRSSGSATAAPAISRAHRAPRNPQRPKRDATLFIILHTTEGPAKGSINKLSANGECHYVVDTDGRVYLIVDENRVAFHCGLSMWNGRTNLDSCSIGIEIVGYHNKEITDAQFATLKPLIARLKKTWGVPDERVLTHSMVAFGNPNHWQKRRHRGRKRCGMLLATPAARIRLGLFRRPAYDPDLRAGRLADADPELTRILYNPAASHRSERASGGVIAASAPSASAPAPSRSSGSASSAPARTGTAPPAAAETDVIGPGRSAWDIARDHYDDPTTIYVFPNGTRKTGTEIKKREWGSMPPGTRVILNADGSVSENAPEGMMTIGVDGAARELTGGAMAASSTYYFPPGKKYAAGSSMTLDAISALPAGTKVLVGYRVVGPVSGSRPVFSLCGTAWNHSDTYYWDPAAKTLTSGEDVSERNIPKGAMVFIRK